MKATKKKQSKQRPALHKGKALQKSKALQKGQAFWKGPVPFWNYQKMRPTWAWKKRWKPSKRKPMEMFRLSLKASPLAREKPFGVALAGQGMPWRIPKPQSCGTPTVRGREVKRKKTVAGCVFEEQGWSEEGWHLPERVGCLDRSCRQLGWQNPNFNGCSECHLTPAACLWLVSVFLWGSRETEEWVPFQAILTRFGLQEAMRRAPWQQYALHILHSTPWLWMPTFAGIWWGEQGVHQGQKRPKGPTRVAVLPGDSKCLQWQAVQAWDEHGGCHQTGSHPMDGSQKGWHHVEPWGRAGSKCLEWCPPHQCQKKAKELAAIKDKESDEEGDAEEDEEEDSKQKLNAAAKEADLLPDMGGSKSKELTAKRILKMLKLVKQINAGLEKGSSGSKAAKHQKELQSCQVELQKLSKQGQKVKLEVAKDTLCEAALAVKRAEKAVEKKSILKECKGLEEGQKPCKRAMHWKTLGSTETVCLRSWEKMFFCLWGRVEEQKQARLPLWHSNQFPHGVLKLFGSTLLNGWPWKRAILALKKGYSCLEKGQSFVKKQWPTKEKNGKGKNESRPAALPCLAKSFHP